MGIFVLWQTINSDDNKFPPVGLKNLLVFHFSWDAERVLVANVKIMIFLHLDSDIDGFFMKSSCRVKRKFSSKPNYLDMPKFMLEWVLKARSSLP
jgi:hypothetical protein